MRVFKYILVRSIILLCALGLFAATAGLIWDVVHFYQKPIQIPLTSTHTPTSKPAKMNIEVKAGQNIDSVSAYLNEQGIIQKPLYFKLLGRWTGQALQLKVGEYEINDGMRPKDILTLLSSGKSIQYGFTLIDGWNFKQFRQAMANNKNLVNTLSGLSDQKIMEKIGFPELLPEGRFLPDTYYFPKYYTDEQLLKRSFEAMNILAQNTWDKRAIDLPIKSINELLTLASIIEKETGVASERPQISGVFIRRLIKNMRLQTDPTVIYGLGDAYTGTITRSNLTTDTPYNTYTRFGLPPSPIAMPSRAAVLAAANPQAGNSLYFVAKGDGSGEHIFSDTLDAHNRAVKLYRLTKGQ